MQKFNKGFVIVMLLGLASLVSAQSSVPNLINFQGLLTDTAGNPVADSTHDVVFRFYDAPSGGTLLWTEVTTQNTVNGVFTHQLGSVTPIPFGYYAIPGGYDSLFLELTVEGQVISPRTHLTSTPFARLADGLEVQSALGGIDDTVVMRIDDVDYWLNIYGDDGTSRARLGFFGRGRLELYNSSAVQTLSLDGGLSGDASAVLPSGAISSPEMLDEPGISANHPSSFLNLTTMADICTTTITTPGPGYIVVLGGGYLFAFGTTGNNAAVLQIDETTGGGAAYPYWTVAGEVDHASTGGYFDPFFLERTYFKSAGTYTFRLEGQQNGAVGAGGTTQIFNPHITAMYFPTSYGSVVTSVAQSEAPQFGEASLASAPSGSGGVAGTSSQAMYQVDLRELELKAARARAEAEKAQRELLEAKVKLERQKIGDLKTKIEEKQ